MYLFWYRYCRLAKTDCQPKMAVLHSVISDGASAMPPGASRAAASSSLLALSSLILLALAAKPALRFWRYSGVQRWTHALAQGHPHTRAACSTARSGLHTRATWLSSRWRCFSHALQLLVVRESLIRPFGLKSRQTVTQCQDYSSPIVNISPLASSPA